jgi:hypothetical protein
MTRGLIATVCLLLAGAVPAVADVSPAQSGPRATGPSGSAPGVPAEGTTPEPGTRKDSSVPPSGIVRPNPNVTRDDTIKPPNVDPGITVPAPGTPGSPDVVVPKSMFGAPGRTRTYNQAVMSRRL